MKTYTATELMTLLQISKGVLYQYRTGYYGKEILIKDKDWKWIDGKIVYYQSAVNKIKENRK